MLPKLPFNNLPPTKQLISGEYINGINGLLISSAINLVATPAGTSSNSLVLNAAFNEVTIVAADGDSVALPKARAGLRIFVNNAGANDLKIWANAADNIEGNVSSTIASGSDPVSFICAKDGFWYRLISAGTLGFVTPQDFGAVGDGVTDDTAALQRAFNRGGVIRGSGQYYVTNTLNLISNTVLEDLNIIAGPAANFTPQSHLPLVFGNIVNSITVTRCTFDISAWTAIPVGVNSLRTVHFYRSFNISVLDNTFTTTGGAASFWACSRYQVKGNRINCSQPGVSPYGFADGIIDNWTGFDIDCERVIIAENTIIGNGYARWGIMFTGLTFVGPPLQVMDVQYLAIANNVISDTYFDGMWIFGRTASLNTTTVTGNTINGGRMGISISDAYNVAVTGNTIENMTSAGIYFWSESAGGVLNSTISGNNLYNVASVGNTPAIWLDFASTGNLVSNNNIAGTTHYFGISSQAQTANNVFKGNRITQGRNSNYSINLTAQNTIDGAAYTPTLNAVLNVSASAVRRVHAYCSTNKVIVFFSITVTPTATGSCTVGMTLPYPSNITDFVLFGSGCTTNGLTAAITNDNANDQALINFTPASTAVHVLMGSFSYDIQ